MKKLLSSLLLSLTVIVTVSPAHASNKCNLFDISKMVGANNITVSGNTMTLNATNISTGKTLHEIAPDLKVGDVAYFSMEGTTTMKYIWLQNGNAEGFWGSTPGGAKTITQADLDGIVKVYCSEPGQTITNLSISTGAVLDSYVPYNPLCATCQGIIKTYESATGTVSQNGTPTPTNPVEPTFYQQGDMILRKVGDVADSYDATTGKITRRVGVKVFDGTEEWGNGAGASTGVNLYYNTLIMDSSVDNSYIPYSTHFNGVTGGTTFYSMSIGTFKHASGSRTWFFAVDNSVLDTAQKFQQFLASQYAAGTPVTVYYPLETAVEETPASTTYCADAIKIATTAYNAAAFAPVEAALESAVTTIKDVVANTIVQADAIQNLQDTKQTRPDAECAFGKTCLLVEDVDGTPHWYEIITEYIPPLPSGYTQLSYIESTGTQYIDTGYAYTNEVTKTYVEYAKTANTISSKNLFGCSIGDSKYITGYIDYINDVKSLGIYIGSGAKKSMPLADYTKHTLEIHTPRSIDDTGYIIYDGDQSTYTKNASNISGANMGIFTQIDYTNTNMATSRVGAFKVYSFKMWDGDTLVRNMVPVQRDSDDEIGMYDLMHGVFYPNAGTGTFTAGPAAQ